MPDNFILQVEDGDKNILYAVNTNKDIVIRLSQIRDDQNLNYNGVMALFKELKRLSEIDRASELVEICKKEVLTREKPFLGYSKSMIRRAISKSYERNSFNVAYFWDHLEEEAQA